jgi:Alpha-(1,6)-fucosyltransferase N- and catalytic domains
MTSWLSKSTFKPIPKKDSFMFETTAAGFCSQFNNYLYATLYAKSYNSRLYVNDTTNAVSVRYPLIQNTFAPVPDISDVQFTSSQILTATTLKNRVIPMREFLAKVSVITLRATAANTLTWKTSLLETIQPFVSEVTADIDVGVHIRGGDKITTGEMKAIPIEQYLQQVTLYQKKIKKEKMNVFLMSDSPERIKEFTSKKDASWTIHTLRSPLSIGGHKQLDFNAAPNRLRMDSYLYFMAELYVMQQVAHVVCTFSSHVGRFLFLTITDDTTIVSIDDAKFVAS